MSQRRFQALRARAKDQAGKPEGDLCAAIAERMLENNPNLEDGPGEVERREYRWTTPGHRDLIDRAARYFGQMPCKYVKGRKRVIVIETDEGTHDLIRYTIDVLRPKMEEVMEYAAAGFVLGAMPITRDFDSDSDDTDSDPTSWQLLEIAAAAGMSGRASRPRRALNPGANE